MSDVTYEMTEGARLVDHRPMNDTALQVPPPDFLPRLGGNIDVPKPTIAAVDGIAQGGGFLLAQQGI
jgi:hypothetical protein